MPVLRSTIPAGPLPRSRGSQAAASPPMRPAPADAGVAPLTKAQAATIACQLKVVLDAAGEGNTTADGVLDDLYSAWRRSFRCGQLQCWVLRPARAWGAGAAERQTQRCQARLPPPSGRPHVWHRSPVGSGFIKRAAIWLDNLRAICDINSNLALKYWVRAGAAWLGTDSGRAAGLACPATLLASPLTCARARPLPPQAGLNAYSDMTVEEFEENVLMTTQSAAAPATHTDRKLLARPTPTTVVPTGLPTSIDWAAAGKVGAAWGGASWDGRRAARHAAGEGWRTPRPRAGVPLRLPPPRPAQVLPGVPFMAQCAASWAFSAAAAMESSLLMGGKSSASSVKAISTQQIMCGARVWVSGGGRAHASAAELSCICPLSPEQRISQPMPSCVPPHPIAQGLRCQTLQLLFVRLLWRLRHKCLCPHSCPAPGCRLWLVCHLLLRLARLRPAARMPPRLWTCTLAVSSRFPPANALQ